MLGLRKPNFKTKIIFLKFLTMPKTVKRGPLRFFNNHSVAKYQNKLKGGPFEDIKKFSKKNSQSRKREEYLLRNTCKKVAHTHGFEHEPSGLKSKHLTTRPRTPELCDLRAETRALSRGKKHPRFPITLAYRKCKN